MTLTYLAKNKNGQLCTPNEFPKYWLHIKKEEKIVVAGHFTWFKDSKIQSYHGILSIHCEQFMYNFETSQHLSRPYGHRTN